MYDQDEVGSFGSAETKLKQLQMKLKESEQQRSELLQESNKLKREI